MNVVKQNAALRLVESEEAAGSARQLKAGAAARKAGSAPARPLHDLHDQAAVESIIYRESARCERTGHEFSLVVFELDATPRVRKILSRVLRERVRATDEVGWFDERRMCAVLPDTGADGARHFVAGVTRRTHASGLEPVCTIYVYPSAWLGGAETSRPAAVTEEQSEDEIDPPTPTPAPAVKQMEKLLVKRIPFWKRMLDMLVSGFMLILLSPILVVLAVIIKLTSKGPVFFAQKRAGLGGRPFVLFKFRTMIPGADGMKAKLRAQSEQDGPAFKMENDPRVTRIGKLLRSTSLDELPQLWNVFKGDMSLVGPRPLPVDEAEACEVWHRRRLDVTPGLTCIWQVKGRSRVSFADWVRMDRSYIRSRSLWNDLSLMLQTVPAVLLRKGAK